MMTKLLKSLYAAASMTQHPPRAEMSFWDYFFRSLLLSGFHKILIRLPSILLSEPQSILHCILGQNMGMRWTVHVPRASSFAFDRNNSFLDNIVHFSSDSAGHKGSLPLDL